MNALVTGDKIAIHARNPVRLRDNPLDLPALPFNLERISDHFGVWHNKAQFVKFQSAPGVTEHSAFVGGIDINENRLDTPGHNAASPYHDVHCRSDRSDRARRVARRSTSAGTSTACARARARDRSPCPR